MTVERKPRARRGSAPGLLREAARHMFAERGYGATTRDIAERAGVSHELIFRYFESKEKLFFEAVLNPLLDAVDELNRRWIEESLRGEWTSDQFIDQFVMTFYDFLVENRSIAQAMMRLMTESSNDDEVEHVRQRIASSLDSMVASLGAHSADDATQTPQPGLQMRVMLLLAGILASILPYTYARDDDAPSRDEILKVLRMSLEPMSVLLSAGRPARRKTHPARRA